MGEGGDEATSAPALHMFKETCPTLTTHGRRGDFPARAPVTVSNLKLDWDNFRDVGRRTTMPRRKVVAHGCWTCAISRARFETDSLQLEIS